MSRITELLNKYNIRPNKMLGQNFLIDLSITDKIIREADIDKTTTVIEVGGGVGSLTGGLLNAAKKVIVIELDRLMCDILNSEYSGELTVINADILKVSINEIINNEENVKICGNLPYYITTPIIMYFLEKTIGAKSMVFMMQKEVADRVCATSGTKAYGAITPVINYHSDVAVIANVPNNCFIPRPTVQSAVVRFNLLEEKRVKPKDEALMFRIIKASFEQRRKTMLNALNNILLPDLGISKEQLLDCFSSADINPMLRGEALDLNLFCRLSDEIFNVYDKGANQS